MRRSAVAETASAWFEAAAGARASRLGREAVTALIGEGGMGVEGPS